MDVNFLLTQSGAEAQLIGRKGADIPTRAALIGVGQFGRTLLMQSRRIPLLDLRVLCDIDLDRTEAVCVSAGFDAADVARVTSVAEGERALDAGKIVITDDAEIAIKLPIDVLVEATGNGAVGAANVALAIEEGRHIALVNKETDSVVGPLLAHQARAAGLVLSQVDGDQPSLLLGLISRARALGFEIACAGKASEHDFVWNPETGMVRGEGGLDISAPAPAEIWDGGGRPFPELIAWRSSVLAAIPQRTPPDYCEMCLVSNASGLTPDRPQMHAAVARMTELPDIFRGGEHGGVFAKDGHLDIFNCLRREDEISAAGGVFAILTAPDLETGELFRAKGIPVSRDARHVLVYNPTHLLGAEAPLSILVPHRLGLSTGAQRVAPVSDLTMRATRDMKAGERLTQSGSHHKVDGIAPELSPNMVLTEDAAVPYFMAVDLTLARDVKAGDAVTVGDVVKPEASSLWAMRAEQDAMKDALSL
ncbi:flagellar biosynthesis protein FlgA [Acuticoccus sp. M5D2P5]|uniref:flagellar biosynthesis protein FlgA n=1 Tax=Acuticoccus kalidii TaxID=2910977 RepID=UPI001F32F415|nr:flagellar biosynthesis protein FlgA [Acuticoccus kalidii]MCF3932356.1 flagellar biosynthesis protein FlgA [Acuticoccus kalidii]